MLVKRPYLTRWGCSFTAAPTTGVMAEHNVFWYTLDLPCEVGLSYYCTMPYPPRIFLWIKVVECLGLNIVSSLPFD